MVLSLPLFSQAENVISRPVVSPRDTISSDSTSKLKKISKDAIDKQVTYSAPGGYIKNDIINRKATIVHNGVVNYGDIEIKADSIIIDMYTNHVYAVGIKDTSGMVVGKPAFRSGSQEFTSDTLEYNFKTKEAIITNIITKQDEGLLHSNKTKLLEDGTSNIFKSTYSTCDADTPHFYINLRKAKVYPGKKIISGPGNLVLEGIPLPLYLPFGYFPIQTKKAASGIIMPKPHYEEGRGYALTDGGYYFAINNNFDLTLKGNMFSNGSWLLNGMTSYNKLYKYNGNFSFSFANNISGHKGLSDYTQSKNYSIGWTYSQSAKARPGSRFSASVNMSSSAFDRNNSYNLADHITTQRQSSISYSKTWDGTPFNLSVSANHSQNTKNKTVALNLPKVSFSASRIYPFRGKNSGGSKKWYQDLQLQYSASVDNQINTYDSLLFTNKIWGNMKSGFEHEVPFSFQIQPFKNFSISPQLSYKGVMYTQKVLRTWDGADQKVVYDTLRGTFYGQAINPSISAGYSPQIFGYYQFTNPNSRIQTIRHVIKPSVTFGFTPYISGLSSKMYRKVQSNADSLMSTYSIYDGGIYGTPSLSSRSGSVGFNLTNLLEAKVFEKNDTTGKPKKINLIDNFNIGTSYNIFADSMRWSPVVMVLRTTLFQNIGISASSNFSLYGLDSKGNTIGTYYFSQTNKLIRLTNFNIGMDFSLNKFFKKKNDKSKSQPVQPQQPVSRPTASDAMRGGNPGQMQQGQQQSLFDEYGYMKFDSPWTMNVRYSLDYSKPALKPMIYQTFSLNGNITLTKKMAITYSTGYDFKHKEITMTQIMITRDLHCWDMSFNWVPNGNMKMWEFTIRVKASVLADLKYDRRKDFHDNY
jgi:hypothetical protein